MRISIVCSDPMHPVFERLRKWKDQHSERHTVELVESPAMLSGGDMLFLVSCTEIVRKPVRDRYQSTLVIHASPLPYVRGWSPHIWQVLQGSNVITVTLLAAHESVDTGDIWAQESFQLRGDELYDEINNLLFEAELRL